VKLNIDRKIKIQNKSIIRNQQKIAVRKRMLVSERELQIGGAEIIILLFKMQSRQVTSCHVTYM
jgi:hypothetical protein